MKKSSEQSFYRSMGTHGLLQTYVAFMRYLFKQRPYGLSDRLQIFYRSYRDTKVWPDKHWRDSEFALIIFKIWLVLGMPKWRRKVPVSACLTAWICSKVTEEGS